MSQYRYTLEDRLGELIVSPLGESDFSITWNKDDSDGKIGYKREFGGKITFIGEAYQRLLKLEQTIYRCEFQDITIQRDTKTWFKGRISLNSGTWDLDGCKVTLKFESDMANKCFEDNKSKEVDLFDLVPFREEIKLFPGNTTIEIRFCTRVYSGGNGLEYYWCGDGTIDDAFALKWDVFYHKQTTINGVDEVITRWARRKMVLPCSETAPPLWDLLIDECVLNGTRTYVSQALFSDCVYQGINDMGGGFDFYYEMDCTVIGRSDDLQEFRNGMLLNEVLEGIVNEFCPDLTVKSDFFGINSNDTSGINYVTGARSKTLNLILFQKSDVKRPLSVNVASNAPWTFEKLINVLANAFNVRWDIEGDEFIIEHISLFARNIGFNLNDPKYSKFIKGKRQYSYKEEDMPHLEKWEWMESGYSTDFRGVPITYDNGCVTEASRGVEEIYIMQDVTTDVEMVISNPDPDSSVVEDQGFVLIAADKETSGELFVLTEAGILFDAKMNNSLAVSQLLRDYHTYNRPFKKGIMNLEETEFDTIKPTKLGTTLTIPFCCGDDFNPNDIVRTFFGDGIIDKAVFNFKSSTIALDLLYDAHSDLIQNEPPTVKGRVVVMFKNEIEIIPVTEGWTDPDYNATILSIEIKTPPTHGTATVRPDFTVRYKPDLEYIGNDNFTFTLKDNWGEESNIGLVSIQVRETNQPPVANDDYYVTMMDTVLNVPTRGVFINDTSSYGFTLLEYQTTSLLGGSVVLQNNGALTFTPLTGVIGVDEFTYTIIDDYGNFDTATVYITIKDPTIPVAVPDTYMTSKNTTLQSIAGGSYVKGLLDNDYTPAGAVPLNATTGTFATVEGGSVIISADGSFLYSPPNDFLGIDSFDYTVNNSHGSDTGTATIRIIEKIYIRMSDSDFKTDVITENCDGRNQTVGKTRTKDITLKFYSDAAGMNPFNIQGLNLQIFAKLQQRLEMGGTWISDDYVLTAIGGINWMVEDDFEYRYEYFGCSGDIDIYRENRYIFESASHYQMI